MLGHNCINVHIKYETKGLDSTETMMLPWWESNSKHKKFGFISQVDRVN